ncbi:MAG: hypothetical protein FK731_02650 [Asgard group archaeon]|nr:hypothetical protein [Asgard group archaeon]
MTTKPKVICFSGSIASGKTSLIEKITEKMAQVTVIRYDDYDQFTEYPKNIKKWGEEGADANLIKNQRMLLDIKKVIAGESVVNPLTEEKIEPADYILVEDPIGTLREEFAQLYDFLIFIEIPTDISLARLIKRRINEENQKEDNQADFNKLTKRISNFLDIYIDFQRDLYRIICDKVKLNADLLLDGQKTLDELTIIVIEKIKL